MMGLVSQGCCNNGSQTRSLKMTQMYCLIVQREEVPNQGVCWLGVLSLETQAQAEDPSLPLPAPGGSRQPSANIYISVSASVFPWPFPTSPSEFPWCAS